MISYDQLCEALAQFSGTTRSPESAMIYRSAVAQNAAFTKSAPAPSSFEHGDLTDLDTSMDRGFSAAEEVTPAGIQPSRSADDDDLDVHDKATIVSTEPSWMARRHTDISDDE